MSSIPARADYSGTPSNATAHARDTSLFDFIAQRLAAGTSGAGTASDVELKTSRDSLLVPMPNILHNPDGAIYQRTPGSTADDVYAADRWYALTQTAAVTSAQVSNPEDGYRYALRLTQSQVTAQRMGYAQIVEGSETSSLRGKTVTFGGRFKLSAAQTLRYAILAWTGTEDTVTSDVVNSWTNATFTTGNFFNASNLSLIAAGSTAMSAGVAATCSVSGVVPSGATNIIVMFWTEAVAAQNVTMDGWSVRLVEAAALVPSIARSLADELRLCQRFVEIQTILLLNSTNGTQSHWAVTKRATPALGLAIFSGTGATVLAQGAHGWYQSAANSVVTAGNTVSATCDL